MVSINEPVPGVTPDFGAASPGQDWASLLVANQTALNNGKVEVGADVSMVSARDQDQAQRDVLNGTVPLGVASPVPTFDFGFRWGLSVTASIVSGGSGYTVGDQVTLAGGTFLVPAILQVASVSSGAVTSFTVYQTGLYTASPGGATMTQGSTTGSGSGVQVTGTWTGNPRGVPTSLATTVAATSALYRFTGNGPSNIGSSGGYGNTTGNDTATIWEWETDAPYLEINVLAYTTHFMLWINDHRIQDADFTTDASASKMILRVNNGTQTMRRYRLFLTSGLFVNVLYQTSGVTFRYPVQHRKLAWGIGDSYMFGNGTNVNSLAAFDVMCERLGIDGIPDGVGGSSWTGGTDGDAVTRVNAKLATLTRTPDIIVWDLGYNNSGTTISTVVASMESAINAAKTLFPNAQHIAFGPATPLGATSQLSALTAAMASEFALHSIPMIDVTNWVNASNMGMYTGPDNIHPTPLGHYYLGARKAAAIRQYLNLYN